MNMRSGGRSCQQPPCSSAISLSHHATPALRFSALQDILEAITSSTSGTSAGADCIDVEFVEEGADDALGVAGSSGACCPGASAVEGDDVGAEDDLQADMQAALNAVDRAHAGGSSSGGGVDAGSSGAGGGSGSSELTDAAARLTV